MRWNAYDWICAGIGWGAALAAVFLVPESLGLLKFAAVIAAGLVATWIVRGL